MSELHRWIQQVAHGTSEEQTEAETQLQQLGEEALPMLHEALEEELSSSQGFFVSDYDALLRLAHCLAILGSPRSLLPLIRVSQLRPDTIFIFREPYHNLLNKLEKRANPEDCAALIDALTRFRQQPALLFPNGMQIILDNTIRQVVLVIVRIAEHDPKPELRAALPLLRYSFLGQPFALKGFYKRLKIALEREPLPIPAEKNSSAE
jgi:HEAT repeat protein